MKRLALLAALLGGCAFTYDPEGLEFITCDAGLTACPGDAPTYCANLAADPANCGACGNACESYEYCDPAGACARPRRVFITSTDYDAAALALVATADAACQSRANAATLGGTWMAWWSTAASNAGDRLGKRIGRFERLDGALVATSFADLTDGSIASALSITELLGSRSGVSVWTGTAPDGTYFNCGNPGESNRTDGAWTADTSFGVNCSAGFLKPLYCFEQ